MTDQPFRPGDRVRFTRAYGDSPPVAAYIPPAERRAFYAQVFTVETCALGRCDGGWLVTLREISTGYAGGGWSCAWFEREGDN